MIRGTTPTLEFELPFEASLCSELYITLSQNGEVIVDKSLTDCNCTGNLASVKLSQEDTLKLSDKFNTEIQVKLKTTDGDVIASDIFVAATGRTLKDEVI